MNAFLLRFSVIGLELILGGLGFLAVGNQVMALEQTVPSMERWQRVDTDPTLTSDLGSSHVCQWLIEQADPLNNQERINLNLLDDCLVRVLESPSGMGRLGHDLRNGDVDLAQGLKEILAGFNFPEEEIERLLSLLTLGQENETLRATLETATHRLAALRPLEEYLLQTPKDWSNCLAGLNLILQGRSPISCDLLHRILLDSGLFEDRNLTTLMKQSQEGEPEAKWTLAQGIKTILARNGALSQELRRTPSDDSSLFDAIWGEVLEEIEQDSLLREEYLLRLRQANPLHQEFQALLAQSLATTGDDFVRGYLEASIHPGSRFQWVYEKLLHEHPEWSGWDAHYFLNSSDLRHQLASDLSERARRDLKWTDYLLWELTRPAEVATMTLRRALPAALSSEVGISKELWSTYEFDLDLSPEFREQRLFDFYPGGEPEFRQRLQQGQLDQSDWEQFGSGFGRLLASSDLAWTKIMSRQSLRSQASLRLCFRAAFLRDPETVDAWVETIRSNDQSLKIGLADWLIKQNKLLDHGTFDRWLDSLSASLQQQRFIGNPDLANFKLWFLDYLQTDRGLQTVESHLALESFGVPEPLREGLAQTLKRDPDQFWKLYGLVAAQEVNHHPNSLLLEEIQHYAEHSELAGFLMEEVTAQNRSANDAMEPVWRQILGSRAETLRSITDSIRCGTSVSDLYGLVILAMNQTIQEKSLWPEVGPILLSTEAPGTTPALAREDCRKHFFEQGAEALPLLCKLLSDPCIEAAWQNKLLSAVNFLEKGYIIADYIQHHHQLQAEWSRCIAQAIVADPHVAQAMFTALIQRRVGDTNWEEQVAQMRYEWARLILEDRVFFEEMLSGQEAGIAHQIDQLLPNHLDI